MLLALPLPTPLTVVSTIEGILYFSTSLAATIPITPGCQLLLCITMARCLFFLVSHPQTIYIASSVISIYLSHAL
jgi:hypothetical protein